MKTLVSYIKETEAVVKSGIRKSSDQACIDWIQKNYHISQVNWDDPNNEWEVVNGVVNAPGQAFFLQGEATEITNGKFKFGEVGEFNCNYNTHITSLKGCPKKVLGDFSCSFCSKINDLTGAPKEVGGNFDCTECRRLVSLKGAPKEVGGEFDCTECPALVSMKYLGHIKRYLIWGRGNDSLDFESAQKEVDKAKIDMPCTRSR